MVNCRNTTGDRGSGKTEGTKVDLKRIADEGQCAVVVFDRPGKMAREMVGQLSAAGHEKRTLLEIASDTETVLRSEFHKDSQATAAQRKNENDLADERFTQVFWAKRGLKSGEQRPYTKLWLDNAVAIWRGRGAPDLRRLGDVFFRGTRDYEKALAETNETDATFLFRELEARCRRNPVQWEIETGAAYRLIKPIIESPVLYLRHGKGNIWEELIAQKMQVYFDLSNVTYEAARGLTLFEAHGAINACREHFGRTREPLSLLVVLEEAGAMDTVTPFIISSMQELRKAGVAVWPISQTINDFGDSALFETILSLCVEHHWYRMNSGIERAGKDTAHPSFNPMEVHFTRERIVSNGFEQIKTTSTGKSSGPDGKIRKDEREGVSFLPKQHIVVEKSYKTPQLHEQEMCTEVSTLQVGWRLAKDLAGVRKEKVIPLPEPSPLGLTEIRTQKAIERIRSGKHFTRVTSESCPPSTTPPAPPASPTAPVPSSPRPSEPGRILFG
jgi:hypothetical protein